MVAIRELNWKWNIISLLVQCLKIFLFPYLKKDFHGIPVIVHFSESGQVLLNFIPITIMHLILKIFHIEEKPRFLLQPIYIKMQLMMQYQYTISKYNNKNSLIKKIKYIYIEGSPLVYSLFEFFLI